MTRIFMSSVRLKAEEDFRREIIRRGGAIRRGGDDKLITEACKYIRDFAREAQAKGFDINSKDEEQRSALYYVVASRSYKLVHALLPFVTLEEECKLDESGWVTCCIENTAYERANSDSIGTGPYISGVLATANAIQRSIKLSAEKSEDMEKQFKAINYEYSKGESFYYAWKDTTSEYVKDGRKQDLVKHTKFLIEACHDLGDLDKDVKEAMTETPKTWVKDIFKKGDGRLETLNTVFTALCKSGSAYDDKLKRLRHDLFEELERAVAAEKNPREKKRILDRAVRADIGQKENNPVFYLNRGRPKPITETGAKVNALYLKVEAECARLSNVSRFRPAVPSVASIADAPAVTFVRGIN